MLVVDVRKAYIRMFSWLSLFYSISVFLLIVKIINNKIKYTVNALPKTPICFAILLVIVLLVYGWLLIVPFSESLLIDSAQHEIVNNRHFLLIMDGNLI